MRHLPPVPGFAIRPHLSGSLAQSQENEVSTKSDISRAIPMKTNVDVSSPPLLRTRRLTELDQGSATRRLLKWREATTGAISVPSVFPPEGNTEQEMVGEHSVPLHVDHVPSQGIPPYFFGD